MQAPYALVKQVAATGKLPVVNFAAGGVAIERESGDAIAARSTS